MELRNTYTSRLRGKEEYDNVEPFSTTHFELALFKNVKPSIYTDKTKARSPQYKQQMLFKQNERGFSTSLVCVRAHRE
jgi:hypothetical protein